jgi:diguanylate cyclase (GGDEF)-like protein
MDLRLALPAFAEEMSSLLAFDRLIAALVNDSGDYIEVLGHPEGSTWGLGNVLPVVGSGPGAVVLNNQAIVQDDLLRSHRFIEDMRLLEEGIRSYMLLPVSSHTRSIGVLGFGARDLSAYSEVVCRRMQPLADAVALALENVRLFQKTRELSITDDVTPLYNFRFFHQILSRELKLVDRYGSMLSIIFVDLDHFKPINDTYGHLRGSRVLREVGFLLRSAVRETDYPVRYGGDEFVVILPQTEGDAAHAIGQKIQQLIEGHIFLQEEGINAHLGLSFGVATYPKDAQTKEALIRLADERMYAEKEARKSTR